MDEIQTHVTSLSGALGLSVAKHVILDLSQGQESFTMWLGLKLETAKHLPLSNFLKQDPCYSKLNENQPIHLAQKMNHTCPHKILSHILEDSYKFVSLR